MGGDPGEDWEVEVGEAVGDGVVGRLGRWSGWGGRLCEEEHGHVGYIYILSNPWSCRWGRWVLWRCHGG